MLGVIATLPSATNTIAQVGAWSSPIFDEFWPFAVYAIGIFLAFWAIAFIINQFRHH